MAEVLIRGLVASAGVSPGFSSEPSARPSATTAARQGASAVPGGIWIDGACQTRDREDP